MGLPGITQGCLDGVMRLIQYDDRITLCRILTSGNSHALLLTIVPGDLVAIKSGFGSGYTGEGSRKFSYALALLDALKVPIDEYEVGSSLLKRLDKNSLTEADIDAIVAMHPVRPQRFYQYIEDRHFDWYREGKLWKEFRQVVPLSIIDSRITDLAITFWDNPDEKLMTGYRRLEDVIRKRTGLTEHGSRLFSHAFNPASPKLKWTGLGSSEQAARANLFSSIYGVHRNPRAHKEANDHTPDQLSEFLLLNHLYLLESESLAVES